MFAQPVRVLEVRLAYAERRHQEARTLREHHEAWVMVKRLRAELAEAAAAPPPASAPTADDPQQDSRADAQQQGGAFDPSQHPRAAAGQPGGGQFIRKGTQQSQPVAHDAKAKRGAKLKATAPEAWKLVASLNQATQLKGPASDEQHRAYARIQKALPGATRSQRLAWINQVAAAHVKAVWGPLLKLPDGTSDPLVARQVRNLSLVPDSMAKRMRASGTFQGFVITRQPLSPQVDPELAGTTPNEHPGQTWAQVGAFYSSAQHVVYVGGNAGTEGTAALHEFGHAMGDALGYDSDQRVIDQHARSFSKLDPYFQQGGPGGNPGRQEFFAESVRAALTGGPSMVAIFSDSPQWGDLIWKILTGQTR